MAAADFAEAAAEQFGSSDNLTTIAAALTSLALSVTEQREQDDREEFLQGKWDEADAVIGRLLDLADWHDTKAEKATAFPGAGPENAARMAKAAEVHADAARRIRSIVNTEEHS